MMTVVRRFSFSAGHRLMGHDGKCAALHGHNYVVHVHARANHLDPLGRVVDFGVLKQRIGEWIEDNWDHGFICHENDQQALTALESLAGQKVFRLTGNPTAENMAEYLLRVVGPQQLAGTGVWLERVAVWETENCHAEATL